MNDIFQQMLHTWSTGGWVMGALALVALITYATAARLLLFLYERGITRMTDTDLGRWVSNPVEAPERIRKLIHYTQEDIHSLKDIEGRFREVESAKIPEVDRRLAFLKIMVVSAPLFGLLGTVLGMLLTFKAIGIGGSSTSEVIARGISEALVATQTGMMVAIPGLAMAFMVSRWRSEYAAFLARLECVSIRHFRATFREMAESHASDAESAGGAARSGASSRATRSRASSGTPAATQHAPYTAAIPV